MDRFETFIEKKIREAMEAGEFDNLPGRGEPIDLSENPFEDPDLRTAHRLLRNAGFAPAWIEERKALEKELERGSATLRRAWELYGKGKTEPHPEWERNVREFRELVDELNQRIKVYNLRAPGAVFQRSHIDVEKMIAAAQSGTGKSADEPGENK